MNEFSSINRACSVIKLVCDGVNLLRDDTQNYSGDIAQSAHYLAHKFDVLACLASFGSLIADVSGASHRNREVFKGFEHLGSSSSFPLKFVRELFHLIESPNITPSMYLQFVKNGIACPLLTLNRVALEKDFHFAKRMQELPPEKRIDSSLVRDDDDWEIVYRNVGEDEINEKISKEKLIEILNIVESSFKFHEAFDGPSIRPPVGPLPGAGGPPPVLVVPPVIGGGGGVPSASGDSLDTLDLVSLKTIPSVFHTDKVLSKYICPLTQEPIRDPVGEPVAKTLYEREAIVTWLKIKPKSPCTGLRLQIKDLIEKPAIKRLIDHRLNRLQGKITKAISNAIKDPAPDYFQDPADRETP